MPIQALHHPRIPSGSLPYSPAVRAGSLLFIAGQASIDAHGEFVTDTFAGEMRRSLENLRTVLEVAGLDFSHVVQVRGYVAQEADVEEYNRIYCEYFSAPFAARTTLIGCLGSEVKFEIDAIAEIPAALQRS